MATIVTVHGTGASGPEEGQSWWQRGSPFEAHLRELVESETGTLNFQPFVWDGANSENARRSAGWRLLGTLNEIESRNEDYCVIGHSHGGSVIAAALFYAARRSEELKRLRSWMTIGTPFLKPQKRTFLFNRINFWEKSAYVVILTLCLLVAAMISAMPELRPLTAQFSGSALQVAEAVAILLLLVPIAFGPAILVLLALGFLNARRRFAGKTRIAGRFAEYFGARWQSFFHEDDEAVRGLGLAQRVEFPIFRGLFFLPQISLLGLLLLPIAILIAASSETAMLHLFDYMSRRAPDFVLTAPQFFLENGELRGHGNHVGMNAALIVSFIFLLNEVGLSWLLDPMANMGTIASAPLLVLVAIFALSVLALAFYIPSMIAVLTVILIGAFASLGLSRILDRVTWGQLRASAFGDDNRAEAISGAGTHPIWLGESFSALPTVLAEEISKFSDAKAALTIGRLRSALNTLAFAEGGRQRSDMLSEYLTWEELIHTSYFQVPRFRKLVAYAISRADGFRPTEAFRADPDYELVAAWFEGLKGGDRGLQPGPDRA